MTEGITTIQQAKELISKLQSDRDKIRKELNIARAIIYDLTYGNKPEPTEAVLKAEVVRLNEDLKASIEKRQQLKAILGKEL